MDRDTKLVACVALMSSLGCWAFVFYFTHVALRAHALGRPTSMEVVTVALVCAVVLAMMAAYGSWISYLVFFRFLTNFVPSGDGYTLEVGGRSVGHAKRLALVRKLGVTELTLIRADEKYWVCRSTK